MYSKNDFGRELSIEVEKKFNVIRIARWAHEKYLDNCANLDRDTKNVMMTIIAMEEGEEFERTKEELLKFAADLQK